jgi:hypothetical protein
MLLTAQSIPCCVCHAEIDPTRDRFVYTYVTGAARPRMVAWCEDCQLYRRAEVDRVVGDGDESVEMYMDPGCVVQSW